MSPSSITTAAQLQTYRDPGCRHELVRGELRRMPFSGWWHGVVAARVVHALADHARSVRDGVALASGTGCWLERDPDTVRAPDAAFVARERLPESPAHDGWLVGAPDFAAEVVEPGDAGTSDHERARCWIAFGARLVWVVDPERRLVTVHRRNGTTETHDADATLHGEDVVPGLVVRAASLFA